MVVVSDNEPYCSQDSPDAILPQQSAPAHITKNGPQTTFFTTETRNGEDLPAQNCKAVSLAARRSHRTPPLGLNCVDIACGTNVRIRAYGSDPHQIGFTAHIDTWDDTKLHSGGCTWFDEALSDPDYSFGTFSTEEDHPWYLPQQCTSRYINFSRPYSTPPRIVVWLTGFDMSHDRNYRVRAYASNISSSGFKIHIDSWSDTILYSASVSWVATPINKPGVKMGVYSTGDVRHWEDTRQVNAGAATFGSYTFGTTPIVFAGLNSLDVDCGKNLRLRTWCDDVTKYGMAWHLDAWHDTILYSASGSYIAMEAR